MNDLFELKCFSVLREDIDKKPVIKYDDLNLKCLHVLKEDIDKNYVIILYGAGKCVKEYFKVFVSLELK